MRRLAAITILSFVALAGCGDNDATVEVVEELVDAHHQAWEDNDANAVGTFFTEDGRFIDLADGTTEGRDRIVAYAKVHVPLITKAQRTGPVEVAEDGTFAVPTELVVTGQELSGDVVVAVEDNLIARYDLRGMEWTTGPSSN